MEAYRRYGPALLRKAQRLLQNEGDAEDVVHALFLELLERPAQVLDLPYLYRAVTNRCLTLLRDRNTRARLLAAHQPELRGPIRTRCEERVIHFDLLAKLVDELDHAHVEALVYRFFDDCTLEEIAELTGVSRKTVGHRLARVQAAVAALSSQKPGDYHD
jgi:RNA polymerase sigma-70 factor, ECF subfamily